MFCAGFEPFTLSAPPPWTGPLAPNEKLNLVDRLFEDELKGPESFAVRDGWIYTGLIGTFQLSHLAETNILQPG